MRVGLFEVQLIKDVNQLLPEHTVDTKVYAVAEPSSEYVVKINIYRDKHGKFPVKYIRVGLFVDGIDVQYWKRIDLSDESLLPKNIAEPASATFFGFKENTSALRSFIFAVPKSTTRVSNQNNELGSVKVDIFEAIVTHGVFHNHIPARDAQLQQSIQEGKKFFEQASVVTTAGSKIHKEKEKFVPLPRWTNKSNEPIQSLTLYYHTLSTIKLLQNIHEGSGSSSSGSSSSSSSSAVGHKRPHDNTQFSYNKVPRVVDLTMSDDDENDNDGGDDRRSVSQSSSSNPAVQREISIDHEISVLVMRPKVLPCLDISDDHTGPKWTTVTEQR